jgi:hypothetical protein
MSADPNVAVALWESPSWASFQVVDEGVVEHCRAIGEIVPVERDDLVTVELVQRDELNVETSPASVTRAPAQVRVAGVRLDQGRARELIGMLTTAVEMIGDTMEEPAGQAR